MLTVITVNYRSAHLNTENQLPVEATGLIYIALYLCHFQH